MAPRLFILCLIFLLVFPLNVGAINYENASAYRKNIDYRVKHINEAGAKVREKLDIAVNGEVGEFQKWKDLGNEVDRYKQTFEGSIPLLDQDVKGLIESSSDPSLPIIRIDNPFAGYLPKAEARISEIQRARISADQKIATIDQQISEINKMVVGSAQEVTEEAITGFVPSLKNLAVGAGIGIFASYFGAPVVLTAAIATTASGIIEQLGTVAIGTDGLATQSRILSDGLKVLRETRDQYQEARQSYQPALNEMQMIRDELKMHENTYRELNTELRKTTFAWQDYLESVRGRRSAESDQVLDERLNRELSEIKRRALWPVDPPQPIQPSEWMPAAVSSISLYADAVQSVIDGGDLRYVVETMERITNERSVPTEEARKKYEEAARAYNEAHSAHIRRAIEISNNASCSQFISSREKHTACIQRVRSAKLASQRQVLGPARAASDAGRQNEIESRINMEIGSATREINGKLYTYYATTNALFTSAVSEVRDEFYELRSAYRIAEQAAHSPYRWLGGLDNLAGRIDQEVQFRLERPHETVDSIQKYLLNNAEMARKFGSELSTNLSILDGEITQLLAAAGRAQGRIESLMARDGLLLASVPPNRKNLSFWSFMEGRGSRNAFQNLSEKRNQRLESMLVVYDVQFPDWIEKARRIDANRIAAVFLHKADEIKYITDAQEMFRYKLSRAMNDIDQISIELTGEGIRATRTDRGRVAADEEMQSAEWTAILEVIEKFPEEIKNKSTPWDVTAWEYKTPGERLATAVAWLHNQAGEDMKNYINSRRPGYGFVPVPEDRVAELSALWDLLKPSLDAFEAKTTALATVFGDADREVSDSWSSAVSAYSSIPSSGRRDVFTEYRRANIQVSWLQEYLGRMALNLRPVGYEEQRKELQAWFSEYPDDLARWKAEQEEAERLAEQKRRDEEAQRQAELEREAEAQRQAELERQAMIDARRHLETGVRDLYQDFINAYGRGDVRGLLRLMADDWRGGDGSDPYDVEEYLTNSFRVFDRIQYRISGFSAQPQGNNLVRVTYDVSIVGENRRQRLTHEEKVRVVEEVGLVDGEPRILRTISGSQWLR